MLTAAQYDSLTADILALYDRYETSVIEDICRRLGKAAFDSAAWQVQRLNESAALYDDIMERLSDLTGQSESELRTLFARAGVKAMRFDDSVYRAAGLNPLPLNMSPAMAQVLAAGLQKTGNQIKNLTMTTALAGQEAYINAADVAYLNVTTGTMSYQQAVRAAVKDVAAQGLSVIQFASRRDQLDVALRRATLTGVAQTVGNLQIARADEMGVDLVQVSAHAGSRPSHQLFQGRIFSRSGTSSKYPAFVPATGYGTGAGLCGWNCVLGDTLVSGPVIRTAYRRKYSGEIIILRTSRGHELTVTPNHPILTDHGWVAAGLLAKGDNVISRTTFNGYRGSSPNINENEARIEDVFNSLCKGRNVFRFPASSGYFHGDVSDYEVEAVFPEGFLRNGNDSALFQHNKEFPFGFTPEFTGPLASVGGIDEVFFGSGNSPDSIMGGFGKFGPPISADLLESAVHGLRSTIGQGYPYFSEIPSDQTLGNTDFRRDFVLPEAGIVQGKEFAGGNMGFSQEVGFPTPTAINALSFQAIDNGLQRTFVLLSNGSSRNPITVETDHIVFIKRQSSQGSFIHVYNLETEGNWYFANNIITHNCRHSFYPFFEGISENAYKQADLDEFESREVKYNGETMPFYDATQQQRGIERKIRYWKRQKAAMEAALLDSTPETEAVTYYQSQMRAFIRETGLVRQRSREAVPGV